MEAMTQAHTILRDLGDGLILRRATLDDAEALATFNAQIFRTAGSEQPNRGIAAWTQDLLSGPSRLRRRRFYHRRGGQHWLIVSSMTLISQTWTYDGIAFGVGRPSWSAHPQRIAVVAGRSLRCSIGVPNATSACRRSPASPGAAASSATRWR